jgi:hypothetical protein
METFDDSDSSAGKPISRRQFLTYLGATSFLIGGNLNGAIAAVNKTLSSSITGDYSFVEKIGLGPKIDAPVVEKYLHPLHKEQIQGGANDSINFTSVKKLLENFYANEAIPWRDDFKLTISSQHYGVAYENPGEADNLVEYSRNVHDYMGHRVRGLFQIGLDWNVLRSDSSNLTSADGFNIVIGRYTYLVSRIFVINSDIENAPYLSSAKPLDRAINYIESGHSSEPRRGLIYLIPGATSLVSPFSEILHISLHKPSKMYEAELNQVFSREISHQKAVQTGETVNEALALMLATEYQEKYGRIDYKKHIDYMAASLARKLPILPNVISYTQKHGLQFTIDQYLENPAKLMAAI